MRTLKALIAFLTILLVVAFGVLVYIVLRQAQRVADAPAPVAQPMEAPAPAVIADERAPWQPLLLAEPAGTRIAAVTGVGDLVVLHLFTGEPGRDERLVVIDPGSGTLMGRVAVTRAP